MEMTLTEMTEPDVVRALAAIAQPLRLRAFRALVMAGQEGVTPSELSALLAVSPSALSFHLKELAASGLARVEQRGRNLIYRARFDHMLALVGYLTQHCCRNDACGAPMRGRADCLGGRP